MNVRLDLHLIGWLLGLIGAFQALPVAAAVVHREPLLPYAASALVALAGGTAVVRLTRSDDWSLRPRDGFLVVGFGWVVASLFGALPYVFAGRLAPADAWFESVSGFTTTGSTVMSGLATAPRALLLWRSFTQWIGGMGIILFTVAILPLLGIGGMQLFRAEVPGPIADKVRPRVAATARRLWLIYVGLTGAEVVMLLAAGLSPFDSVCHALTTVATGGFSTRDLSVEAFASPAVEWILTGFMFLAGVNFVLHYRLLTGRVAEVWRDSELRYFCLVIVGASALVTVALVRADHSLGHAVRLAAFQVVSVLTTTGYTTADFELWPSLSHLVFIVLMVLGGMSGSTGGGVKSLRALLGVRALGVSFERLLHPRAVRSVKYGGRPVGEEVLAGIWAFFTAYFLIATVAAAAITAAGYDIETAFSAALTALGNVGPGLGQVGAYDNFAHFPVPIKLVLTFCMLAGRLEVFTLLVLIVPRFWRR
jgi:trk system potassium uptake protein TrkH